MDKIIELYKGSVKIKFTETPHAYWLIGDDGKMKRLCGTTTHIGVLDKPALVPWAVNLTVDFIRKNMEVLKSGDMEAYQILELARKESSKQKDIAAEIGKAIHAWIEAHVKGEEPEMPEDPKVLQGIVSFLDWVADWKVKFLWAERIVYSKKYGYVGTADFGAVFGAGPFKGKKVLGDTKTGNAIYKEVKQQTASYLKGLTEESGEEYDGRLVIRISKETEEEYMARMQKKVEAGKLKEIPPFQIFQAVYLDNDPESLERDFNAYLASITEYEWGKIAEKELKELIA